MATFNVIEREIQYLKEDIDVIHEEITAYKNNQKVLKIQIAAYGGENFAPLNILSTLRNTSTHLESLRQDLAERDSRLLEKQAEKDRLNEVEELFEGFESAVETGNLWVARNNAARLKTFAPDREESISSGMIRLYWKIADESVGYKEHLKALEWLETYYYRSKNETGLQDVRERLAQLLEEQGEEKIETSDFRLAIYFFKRAYNKYDAIDDPVSKSRVQEILGIIYEELGEPRLLDKIPKPDRSELRGNNMRNSYDMCALPPDLYRQLCDVLSSCGPFTNDDELRAIFVNEHINPWRGSVPQAQSPTRRIEALVNFLCDKRHANGENALILFLSVLKDRAHPGDACHQRLADLVDDLKSSASPADGSNPQPNPNAAIIQSMHQELEIYERQLQRLKKQIASAGGEISAPVGILEQHDQIAAKIESLQAELRSLER